METIILGLVIILQFLYMFYSDYRNRQEREALELKLMSQGNLEEYKRATEPTPKDTREKPDPYVDPSEVDTDTLLKAEDRL